MVYFLSCVNWCIGDGHGLALVCFVSVTLNEALKVTTTTSRMTGHNQQNNSQNVNDIKSLQ